MNSSKARAILWLKRIVKVFAASVVLLWATDFVLRNFIVMQLARENRVLSGAEISARGIKIETALLAGDPQRIQIRVMVGRDGPFRLTNTALRVAHAPMDRPALEQLYQAAGTEPVWEREESTNDATSRFILSKAEAGRSFLTILYLRDDSLRFWGPDARRYLVPIGDVLLGAQKAR